MAEREGFEPSVHLLNVHTISNRAPSTTRTPLHLEQIISYQNIRNDFYPNLNKLSNKL